MPILTNVRENEWKRETEGENEKKREIFLKFFGALVAKGFAHLTAEPAVSSSNPAAAKNFYRQPTDLKIGQC